MSKIDDFPYDTPIPAKIWRCSLWSRFVIRRDHHISTLQTDGRTDRQLAMAIPRSAQHRAVKSIIAIAWQPTSVSLAFLRLNISEWWRRSRPVQKRKHRTCLLNRSNTTKSMTAFNLKSFSISICAVMYTRPIRLLLIAMLVVKIRQMASRMK